MHISFPPLSLYSTTFYAPYALYAVMFYVYYIIKTLLRPQSPMFIVTVFAEKIHKCVYKSHIFHTSPPTRPSVHIHPQFPSYHHPRPAALILASCNFIRRVRKAREVRRTLACPTLKSKYRRHASTGMTTLMTAPPSPSLLFNKSLHSPKSPTFAMNGNSAHEQGKPHIQSFSTTAHERASIRPAKNMEAFNSLLPPQVEFVEGSSTGTLALSVMEGKYEPINASPKASTEANGSVGVNSTTQVRVII